MSLSSSSSSLPLSYARFKLILVGDGGVGKTTFITRHRTGEFEKRYIPTLGIDVNPLPFYTNLPHSQIVFNVWDTAGQEKFGGLKDGYYIGGQAVIVMFDLTAKITYQSVPHWIKDVRRVCGTNVPIVICGNKSDCKDIKVTAEMMESLSQSTGCPCFTISSKNNFQYELPFLHLIRTLSGEPNIKFVQAPVLMPPEVTISPAQVAL